MKRLMLALLLACAGVAVAVIVSARLAPQGVGCPLLEADGAAAAQVDAALREAGERLLCIYDPDSGRLVQERRFVVPTPAPPPYVPENARRT